MDNSGPSCSKGGSLSLSLPLSPSENSVSCGSASPVNRYLSTGYHHILAKSLSIGPRHEAAILDLQRGWKGIKIAKVQELSFFNFPRDKQIRKRTPSLESIICYEDILYYYRSVCHYYSEIRNKNHSPSWQFSCPFSLVSNPKWRLRDKDLLENSIGFGSAEQPLNYWGLVN